MLRAVVHHALAHELFDGVATGHLSKMAARVRSPAFMLHDLCKLLTVGERLSDHMSVWLISSAPGHHDGPYKVASGLRLTTPEAPKAIIGWPLRTACFCPGFAGRSSPAPRSA